MDDRKPEVESGAEVQQVIGLSPGPPVNHQVVVVLSVAQSRNLQLFVEPVRGRSK